MFLNKSIKSLPLFTARGINPNVSYLDKNISVDSDLFIDEIINSINNNSSILPSNPGFEKHPYKNILQNIQAKKYIIGTFPPISYLIDTICQRNFSLSKLKQPSFPNQEITQPQIPFYHGNVSGLWGVLFTEEELIELKQLSSQNRYAAKDFLIHWLNANDIFYDDIILYTQRKLGKLKPNNNLGYTYEDVNLKHICPDEELINRVLSNLDLGIICFTNGMTFRSGGLSISNLGLVETENSDALSLFLRACQNIGLKIEMQCMPFFDWTILDELTPAQKRTKLIFALRFTKTNKCENSMFSNFKEKIVTVLTPFSPAAHGKIESHPIVVSMRNTIGINCSASRLLPLIYDKFRNNTYQDLYQFNIN